jgi:blocked-early-in-transport protein 1|eukprot:180991_1
MHQRRSGSGYNNSNSSGNGHFNNSNMNRRGNPYDPERGALSASEMNANIVEQQNNDKIDQLSDQVALLKGLTIDIGNEVREQNSLLDQMGDGFANTGDMLAGSLKKIGNMLESGGAKHMCYMVGFIVVVMILLYMLMKSGR